MTVDVLAQVQALRLLDSRDKTLGSGNTLLGENPTMGRGGGGGGGGRENTPRCLMLQKPG